MSGTTEASERLRSLVAEELGECCEGDLADRVAALDDLDERATAASDPDDRRVLGALAGETRYRLARLLAAADGECCVCELEPLVEVSSSAVSHALSDLADAGLVTRRKEGRWRYYRTTDRAEGLLAALDGAGDD